MNRRTRVSVARDVRFPRVQALPRDPTEWQRLRLGRKPRRRHANQTSGDKDQLMAPATTGSRARQMACPSPAGLDGLLPRRRAVQRSLHFGNVRSNAGTAPSCAAASGPMTRTRMKTIADRYLPFPRILHPWPEKRFLVTIQAGARCVSSARRVCAVEIISSYRDRPLPASECQRVVRRRQITCRDVCCSGKSGSRDCVARLPSLTRSRPMSSRDFTALTAHYWMVLIRAGVSLTGSPTPPVGSRSRLQLAGLWPKACLNSLHRCA